MNNPSLLIHICCGPCATGVVGRLKESYNTIGFFYNPNIFPEEEFQRRLSAVQEVARMWSLRLETGEYEHDRFLLAVRGLEDEPEGGRRCERCFYLRLERSVQMARGLGCAVLASTLTIGPNKRAAVINRIGTELCNRVGIEFLAVDWKKGNGFKKSVQLSREFGLYRQVYCGCEFSRPR